MGLSGAGRGGSAPRLTLSGGGQVSRHERRSSQLQALNEMPLYPTEAIIWDSNVVPSEYFSGEGCLALPKLNLQFLTLHDYLLRNFNLFRLESTCESAAVSRWSRPRRKSSLCQRVFMVN